MAARRFHVVDVFTTRRFGGNPLAVVLDGDGLSEREMQAIAREFNYSETSFVRPARSSEHTAELRIFTPGAEIPFAGHPNIGTAFALAQVQANPPDRFVFEEKAGLVAIDLVNQGGQVTGARLTAPQHLSTGPDLAPVDIAACLSVPTDQVSTALHPPLVASVGLPFVVVELASRAALRSARPDMAVFETTMPTGGADAIYAYTRELGDEDGQADWTARMFSPLDGIPEDPATGSATAAAAALLASIDRRFSDRPLIAVQGVDMGRPSRLDVQVDRAGTVRLGGACVKVMQGELCV